MITPNSAEISYMLEHINDTKVPAIITSSVICNVAACIAVALRFYSRHLKRAGLRKDDYFITIGLVRKGGFCSFKAL